MTEGTATTTLKVRRIANAITHNARPSDTHAGIAFLACTGRTVRLGDGWTETPLEVTCKRCVAKLERERLESMSVAELIETHGVLNVDDAPFDGHPCGWCGQLDADCTRCRGCEQHGCVIDGHCIVCDAPAMSK